MSLSIAAETTWDAAVRELYNRGAEAVRAQALESVRMGRMTAEQAKFWAVGQRNALIKASRDQSTPFGRLIAECIKPRRRLNTIEDLEKLGKSAEGIIESSGKTNPWVNRITVGLRYAGPTLLVIEISFSAYHIATAPQNEQWYLTAKEAGSWTGTIAFGWVGGTAGCEIFGALGSLAPVAGNIVGCAAGVVVGTIGGSIFGNWAGSGAGDFVYRSLSNDAAVARPGGGSR